MSAWTRRRAAPLTASTTVVLLSCGFVPWWSRLTGPNGARGWYVPGDLWGTQLAAWEYLHGHVGAVYSPATALVTLPGILVVLAPAVALAGALHLPVLHAGGHTVVSYPTGWVLVEAASIAAGLPLLFATDGLAERLGVPSRRRFLLAALEAVALWNVVVWWGHPEDALAVALLLFGTGAARDGRWRRAGWLFGLAVATQPVVLLALFVVLAGAPRRVLPGLVPRVAAPSAILVAAPLATNWHGTLRALVEQPNYPLVDHTTPWTSLGVLAPVVGTHTVASGPLRFVAVLAAFGLGLWAGRHHRGLGPVLLVMAACFALRVLSEPVMVAYYVWPVLALALVAASAVGSRRLAATGAVAVFATVFGGAAWRGNWSWWAIEVGCVAAALALAVPGSSRHVPDTIPDPIPCAISGATAHAGRPDRGGPVTIRADAAS